MVIQHVKQTSPTLHTYFYSPNSYENLHQDCQLTCFKLSLQRGHWGVWSKQRSKQFLQKVWPHGVVTGS